MQDVILHPTASTPVPVTHCKPGKAKGVKKARDLTCDDLRAMLAARGIKWTTAHTKGELRAMHISGEYQRPAAYDRQNAKRAQARVAKRATISVATAIATLAQ